MASPAAITARPRRMQAAATRSPGSAWREDRDPHWLQLARADRERRTERLPLLTSTGTTAWTLVSRTGRMWSWPAAATVPAVPTPVKEDSE